MSTPLIALVAIIYLYVAIEMLCKREYGSAMAWACYALANIGFIIQYALEISRRTTAP